jgi:hypothetical protein
VQILRGGRIEQEQKLTKCWHVYFLLLEVLDALSDWVMTHVDVCRPHDFTALLLTLATVFHTPSNADHLFNVSLKDYFQFLFLITELRGVVYRVLPAHASLLLLKLYCCWYKEWWHNCAAHWPMPEIHFKICIKSYYHMNYFCCRDSLFHCFCLRENGFIPGIHYIVKPG